MYIWASAGGPLLTGWRCGRPLYVELCAAALSTLVHWTEWWWVLCPSKWRLHLPISEAGRSCSDHADSQQFHRCAFFPIGTLRDN